MPRLASLALATAVALGVTGCNVLMRAFMNPEDPPEGQSGLSLSDLPEGRLEVVVEGLEVPWEIVFLPEGGLLVSQRTGRLTRFPRWGLGDLPLRPEDGQTWIVDEVAESGEGGLMGLAIHPRLSSGGDPWVYLMLTAEGSEGLENRVERWSLTDAGLVESLEIIGGIPGNRFHDGGRIAFGPDGYLYVTTGDAGDPTRAQDPTSLSGKILRLDEEGAVPPTNPFGSPIWSLGHRNPQGLAWDREGHLWSTEHGRSGFRSGMDEVNLIQAGENYGWPDIEGDGRLGTLRPPVIHSGEDYTWAPGAIVARGDRLYFGGLRGEALYEARVVGDTLTGPVAHFVSELGRIRALAIGPDGMLYLTTSNRDGRGAARDGDDKILRLDLSVFAP